MTTITFTIPNHWWLSSNQRIHWAVKAKCSRLLRQAARYKTVELRDRYAVPVRITAHIGYATNGRADPANAHPTVKALVDGLVDAGVFIDDSHEHVIGPDYRRDDTKAPKGFHTVRFEIEEVA